MGGQFGLPELLLIGAVALVIFGPARLPELGRSLGRAMREFRSAFRSLDDDDPGSNGPAKGPGQPTHPAAPATAAPSATAPATTAPVAAPSGAAQRGPGGAVAEAREGGSVSGGAGAVADAAPATGELRRQEPAG